MIITKSEAYDDDIQSSGSYSSAQSSRDSIPLRPVPPASGRTNLVPKEAVPFDAIEKQEVFWLIVRNSVGWVSAGVSLMLISIAVIGSFFLPLIFTCPPTAVCSHHYDPNSSNVLQLLQAFMGYCHMAGTIIAGIGLVKLTAYQTWFILMRSGSTIHDLDLHLGAAKGSMFDALSLMFRRGNRFLSILILIHVGISTAISPIIGLSFQRVMGTRRITFQYPATSNLDMRDGVSLNSAFLLLDQWAISNDTSHGSALLGALVVRDERSHFSDAQLGGPRIHGEISCSGIDNYTLHSNMSLDLFVNDTIYYDVPYQYPDASVLTLASTASDDMNNLWIADTALPNATVVNLPDYNNLTSFIALCNHIVVVQEVKEDPDVEYLQPTVLQFPEGTVCMDSLFGQPCPLAGQINWVISYWWTAGYFWGPSWASLSCRGGLLGPFRTLRLGTDCNPLDMWNATVSATVDALVQAATPPKELVGSQVLAANVSAFDIRRWWLQGLIPLCTIVLYGVSLIYTCQLSKGNKPLKKLNLGEILQSAQREEIQVLTNEEKFRKSAIRYGSESALLPPPADSELQGLLPTETQG